MVATLMMHQHPRQTLMCVIRCTHTAIKNFDQDLADVIATCQRHIRLHGCICVAMSNIRKLTQARPTMPAFL